MSLNNHLYTLSGDVKTFDIDQVRANVHSVNIVKNGLYCIDEEEFDEVILSLTM